MTTQHELEHLLRQLTPQVLAAVTRRHGDFAEAEDAVQDALLAAVRQWPAQGVPRNPKGWLYQVALRRLTDQLRSELARRRRQDAIAEETMMAVPLAPALEYSLDTATDDTLLLLFMCCHPALTSASAIALTLRAVGGLTTAEIARAFLVPEATMAQRITRAKQQIKSSGIPFEQPSATDRAQRLSSVLHVLYLIYNEGYAASSGADLQRVDLSNEAIRLTREVHALLPREPEVAGLLALLLLTDARRAARTGPYGELIPLDEQDRSLWDRQKIAEGTALITSVLAQGAAGYYTLQAAIAAVHDQAARAEDTDWTQILALYELLKRIDASPMVALSHAVAFAMVHGAERGLELLAEIARDERMQNNHRVVAVQGHLLERAGKRAAARSCFERAAAMTMSVPERNYLLTKVARLGN